MTIFLFALGGLALLVVIVIVIGLLMPERYDGRSQVVYAKTAEDVWEALLDYDSHLYDSRYYGPHTSVLGDTAGQY